MALKKIAGIMEYRQKNHDSNKYQSGSCSVISRFMPSLEPAIWGRCFLPLIFLIDVAAKTGDQMRGEGKKWGK
jgi:hypothetical protein